MEIEKVAVCLSFTLALKAPLYKIKIFTHFKLWLATATHNLKWLEITRISLMWDQTSGNFNV